MKIHHDIIQNTPEWLAVRAGKFTASMFADLFAKESTKTYQNAINKVVYERLTGESPESFSNEWTERGHELEPVAIEAYELLTFNKVTRVGFIEYNEWIGCSPDGLIGEKGMFQAKCPKFSTLIDYYITDKIPADYYTQMQGELFVSGREFNEFYVFHPKLKPILKRVNRDEKHILEIRAKLETAIELVNERITIIKGGK